MTRTWMGLQRLSGPGMSFYNKLYNANLLDPDCFITKGEDLTEKYTKGQYLGGYVNWHFGNYNKNARAADPETEKQYVILPTYMGWANERNYAGWQANISWYPPTAKMWKERL